MDLLKLIAHNQNSIFESILTPIRKLLSLDNSTVFNAPSDGLERCNDMMDMLNHLVAAQSREQWVSISHQLGPKSSNMKGTALVTRLR